MPKLKNSLPKYRKKSVRGRTYGVVTIDGKDHYLGDYGTETSKRDYDRLIGEWLANGRRSPNKAEQPITITDLIVVYWRHCKTYYVKNGQPTDELAGIRAALKPLRQLYGDSLANEFGPLSLESVRQQMIANGNSRKYINQNVSRIRGMFKWAVSKQLISVNCHLSLQALSGLRKGKCEAIETEPVESVAIEVVESTLVHCSKTVADVIRVQLLLGCRPGKIFCMKPSEIDRTQDVWRYRPGSHKMEHRDRSRVILIGQSCCRICCVVSILIASKHRKGNRFADGIIHRQSTELVTKHSPHRMALKATNSKHGKPIIAGHQIGYVTREERKSEANTA